MSVDLGVAMSQTMTDTLNPLDRAVASGELVAELRSHALSEGANEGLWPGLTVYRFDSPAAPQWEEVRSLSLSVVAQGSKTVTIDGSSYHYDPLNYLVLCNRRPFQAVIREASPAKPFLSFVLQIDPGVVRQVSADIFLERETVAFRSSSQPKSRRNVEQAFVSSLDRDMLDAVLRFLRALSTGADRRVLAPIYLREIVYRTLQAEQYTRLIEAAARESASNPVSAIIAYVREHIAEPMTVSDLAERALMSPSAFSHLFRDVTGKSPYQFVKEMRLNRAHELLIENDCTVTQISQAVGYNTTSHFINEFRDRYGMTPRACSVALASGEL
jgi:AraC-like DNA-binding protein